MTSESWCSALDGVSSHPAVTPDSHRIKSYPSLGCARPTHLPVLFCSRLPWPWSLTHLLPQHLSILLEHSSPHMHKAHLIRSLPNVPSSERLSVTLGNTAQTDTGTCDSLFTFISLVRTYHHLTYYITAYWFIAHLPSPECMSLSPRQQGLGLLWPLLYPNLLSTESRLIYIE